MKSLSNNRLRVARSRGGFTVIELLVSVSVVVLVGTITVFGLGRVLTAQSESAARLSIRAALARAQAHALANNRPAGVRFQFDKDGWRNGRQYMVVVEKTVDGITANEFAAVPDTQPIALPRGVGAMAVSFENTGDSQLTNDDLEPFGSLDSDYADSPDEHIMDAMTFTIVFSAKGTLTKRPVFVRRRKELFRTDLGGVKNIDPIFNEALVKSSASESNLEDLEKLHGELPLLYQDWFGSLNAVAPGYSPDWCLQEDSQLGFFLFDISELQEVDPDNRYEGFFQQQQPLYVNYYTGDILEEPSLGLGE